MGLSSTLPLRGIHKQARSECAAVEQALCAALRADTWGTHNTFGVTHVALPWQFGILGLCISVMVVNPGE